jgi:hypothetical protein
MCAMQMDYVRCAQPHRRHWRTDEALVHVAGVRGFVTQTCETCVRSLSYGDRRSDVK